MVSVVEKSNEVDVTAMKAARKLRESAEENEVVATETKAEAATEETASE